MEMSAGAMSEMGRALTSTDREVTKSSQHKGEVLRIDPDGTIWVRIYGGADETPVKETTVSAAPGMVVSITIQGGKATITGSTSAPSISTEKVNELMMPISDAAQKATASASVAEQAATSASAAAAEANRLLDGVEEVAEQADKTVAQILSDAATAGANAAQAAQDAATALQSATEAQSSARGAGYSLSEVERVVGTLNWISEHGTYTAASETSPVAGRIYYTRSGSGTTLDPYRYTFVETIPYSYSLTQDVAIDQTKTYYVRSGSGTTADPYEYEYVTDPDAADIATYYERHAGNPSALGYYYLVVDESVENYLASHLSQTQYGLDLMVDNSDFKIHLGTVDGSNDMGMHVVDATGTVVARFASTGSLVGDEDENHVTIEQDGAYFWKAGQIIAAMQRNGNQSEMYVGDPGSQIYINYDVYCKDTSVTPNVRRFDYAAYSAGQGVFDLYITDTGTTTSYTRITKKYGTMLVSNGLSIPQTRSAIENPNNDSRTYDILDKNMNRVYRILYKDLGSNENNPQRVGITAGSYIVVGTYNTSEYAWFDGENNEISSQFEGCTLSVSQLLTAQSYNLPMAGIKFYYGTDGKGGKIDGEQFYMVFKTSYIEGYVPPVYPCFVLDDSTGKFYWMTSNDTVQIAPSYTQFDNHVTAYSSHNHDSRYLKLEGGTMIGVLNAPYYVAKTSLVNVNGSAPANDQWEPIMWGKDASGNVVGYIENYHGVTGNVGANYCAKRTINGTTYYNFLSLQIRPNGRRYLDIGTDDVNMQGSMSVVTHGGSWISQVSAAAPIIVSPAIPTDGSRYDAIMRGTFADGSRWTVGGIEKSLDIAYFTANRTANGNDGRIRFTPDTGRILAWGSSPRVAVGTEGGGSNQTGGNIGVGMYTDGEGGNLWWTAKDGSYNEIDSYNNTQTRIYTHTSNDTWGGVYWTRAKSYNLDYLHGWECIHYHAGGGWVGWSKSDYNEFLVVCRYGGNYNGSILIQRDHIDGTSRQYYLTGGYNGAGYNGRSCAFDITDSGINLRIIAIDANVNQNLGSVECWIYARR